jgi:hypothetical protein
MHTDATEQLNRYFQSKFKSTGVIYQPTDLSISLEADTHSKKFLSFDAMKQIDRLADLLHGCKIGVSNWFDLSDVGGKHILTLTYRVIK